jgi:hypothetical protein
MFGLMKGTSRLPYCGTCKTMGALYGQRTRLLLNHDAVFLAELMISHTAEPDWSPAYRSFNCASVPRENRPVALEFAATAAVTMAHFKVVDQREDSGGLHWRAAQRFFYPGYRKAERKLRGWQFPVDELTATLATQRRREAGKVSFAQVAEPTAAATALFFQYGARMISRPELEQTMSAIGNRFGTLIYLLDAHEDRARDARTGEFNALAAFPDIDSRAEILRLTRELEPMLPKTLAARLCVNIEERLGLRPRVLHQRCRKTAGERWREALLFASRMKEKEQAGLLKGSLVFATAAAAAFLVPHQARSAESWRHCLGLGMNLMALGGVLAMASVPPPVHEHVKKAAETTSTGGGCNCCSSCDCDGSCCDCCGACDC